MGTSQAGSGDTRQATTSTRRTIRVLIADDHRVLRQGLRSLLAGEPDIEVVGEAADGHTAVSEAISLRPDIVIMDLGLPGIDGVTATRQVCEACPATRVLVLTMHVEPEVVVAALRAGAWGYVLKDCAFEELALAIRTLRGGDPYLCPPVQHPLLKQLVGPAGVLAAPPAPTLTPREREIIRMVAEGLATKEIARSLALSVKTIETHRQRIMAKLDLRSVAELTKYAIRAGITSLDK